MLNYIKNQKYLCRKHWIIYSQYCNIIYIYIYIYIFPMEYYIKKKMYVELFMAKLFNARQLSKINRILN